MPTDPGQIPLSQRGVIGDGGMAAVVAADGSIDWWCPGRLDRPAACYRLLDPLGGGVRVGSAGPPSSRRRQAAASIAYEPGTNGVRTVLRSPSGLLEVLDHFPWRGGAEWPEGRIVRVLTALSGPVEAEVEVVPGQQFGPAPAVSAWSEGVVFGGVAVRAGVPFRAQPLTRDVTCWRAGVRLEAGERLVVTVDDAGDDHHRPLSADAAMRSWEATAAAWRFAVGTLTYEGPWREAVERSALALRLLTVSATGGLAGAVTMSLPQRVGGERNADRRGVGVADAARAVRLLRAVGLDEHAAAIEGWLTEVVRGGDGALPGRRDLDGGPGPEEEELDLPGWRRSQPVHSGWVLPDREGQRLDVLADVAALLDPRDRTAIWGAWNGLVAAGDWVADHWGGADLGWWDLRSGPRPWVASKIAARWGLRRLASAARSDNPLNLDAAGWDWAAVEILRWLEQLAGGGALPAVAGGNGGGGAASGAGWSSAGGDGSGGGGPGGDWAEAGLLRVLEFGPWPANHPGRVATVDRVLDRLGTGPLLHRYPDEVDDGWPSGMGADIEASFWAVTALAGLGRWEDAHARMEGVLSAVQAPLGLLSEQVDPLSGDLLGDLPSAGAHLALIEAAVALSAGPS